MSKYKVISVGDRYCVMKLADDGIFSVVKGSYRNSWHGAQAHMEALEFVDAKRKYFEEPKTPDWYALATCAALVSTLLYVFAFV